MIGFTNPPWLNAFWAKNVIAHRANVGAWILRDIVSENGAVFQGFAQSATLQLVRLSWTGCKQPETRRLMQLARDLMS